MKINNVTIENWEPPGGPFWANVEAKPDEPLIEATVSMTLSHHEYHRLLDMDERKSGPSLRWEDIGGPPLPQPRATET